jgi:hypothetical protein
MHPSFSHRSARKMALLAWHSQRLILRTHCRVYQIARDVDAGASAQALMGTNQEPISSLLRLGPSVTLPPMLKIVADPPDPSCSVLFSGTRIQESQELGLDTCARDGRGRFAKGNLRQSAGPAARDPQSKAVPARSWCPAAEYAGGGGSDRPSASSVAAPRRATLAVGLPGQRSGRAPGDLLVAVAHGRQVLTTVLATVVRAALTPGDGVRIARRVQTRLRAIGRTT